MIRRHQLARHQRARHRLALSAAAAALAALLGAAAPAAATSMSYTVTLGGKAEVPGPGSPDGGGIALVTVDDASNTVCWSYTVVRLETPTAAHIHKGAAGVAGNVVVPLSAPGADGLAQGCVPVDHALAADLLASPAGYYVNVHDKPHPAGAVRGQLNGG